MKIPISVVLAMAVSINVSAQNPSIKWWYDTNDSAFGSAAAGDLDGDGNLEVIFGCYRNDSTVYVLNGEDGSLLWKKNLSGDFEGCNDVAPIIYDIDQDGDLDAVVPSSCNPKTFAFEGSTGEVIWETELHGSDSPPTISDIDRDGKPEILHGNFGGTVTCLEAEDGSIKYDLLVEDNSWIQTAPTIFDANNDGQPDFFVASSSFSGSGTMYCIRWDGEEVLWENDIAEDNFYHGASVADIDNDGFKELVVGNYDGSIYCLNAEDGSLAWIFEFSYPFYTPMATSIGDLNNDGFFEIIIFDYNTVGCLNAQGELIWSYDIPDLGQSFRGASLADVTGDNMLDVVFGATNGRLYALHGADGSLAMEFDLGEHVMRPDFQLDHGPLVSDFDNDGFVDIFVVGGYTNFPDFSENYGRAYMISTDSPVSSEWLMFRADSVRSGHVPLNPVTAINTPQESDLDFTISPNPAVSECKVLSTETIESFELRDEMGRMLMSQTLEEGVKEMAIDVSKFIPGVYFISVNGKGTQKKLVVVD